MSATPEAIEAASKAIFETNDPFSAEECAIAALSAAAPFIAAQAKAEALREAAEYHAEHIGLYSDWGDIQDRKAKKDYESTADWLRARAATIEGKSE